MSTWKKVIRYSLRVDGKFKNQYTTLEAAERQAAKYQVKGKSTSIKEVEVECMSVNFGVI